MILKTIRLIGLLMLGARQLKDFGQGVGLEQLPSGSS
jgi:hypothetical protein